MTSEEKTKAVKEWLSKTKINQEVVEHTLDVSETSINPRVLLAASKKLIKLNRLEVEPDHRDDLRFNTFHGIEDYVYDHIDKDHGRLQAKAKFKMQQKKDLSWLHTGFFSPQIKSVIIGNSLAQSIEGHNPMDNFDVSHKVSKLGEGGIGSLDSVPDEARLINSSSFGFQDPFRVSESLSIGADHRFAHNVVKGKDKKLYKLVQDKSGNLVWVDHETLLNSKVEIPEH